MYKTYLRTYTHIHNAYMYINIQIPSRAIYAPYFQTHLIEPTVASNKIST